MFVQITDALKCQRELLFWNYINEIIIDYYII